MYPFSDTLKNKKFHSHLYHLNLFNALSKFSIIFQAHFVADLPDISPLSRKLVYLNLSFNDFAVSILTEFFLINV